MSVHTWLSDPWGVEVQKAREASAARVSPDARYIVRSLITWFLVIPAVLTVVGVLLYLGVR